MKKKIKRIFAYIPSVYTKISIVVLAMLLLTSISWNVLAARSKTAEKLSISFQDKTIAPFSILKIPGKGIDVKAATSVIFSAQSGSVITVPAISVSSSEIEVPVPPMAWSEGRFTQEKVSLQLIQIKESGNKATAMTSNEISGVTTNATAHVYDGLPNGALTRSFIAASLDSLRNSINLLPIAQKKLRASLVKSQISMEQILNGVKTVIKDPSARFYLRTNDGANIAIGIDDLAMLDAFYAGFLGQLKERRILSAEKGTYAELIPAAMAYEMSECKKQALGEGVGDTAYEKLIDEPCRYRESALEQSRKAGDVLPEAAKFAYSPILILSSISLHYAAAEASLSAAAQIGLSAGFTFLTETLIDTKKAVSNGATSIAKAIADHALKGPFLEIGIPSAKLFYEVNEAMSPQKIKSPTTSPQAIVSKPDEATPTVQWIQATKAGGKIASFTILDAQQSLTFNQESNAAPTAPTRAAAPPSTPKSKSTPPTPESEPSALPPTQPSAPPTPTIPAQQQSDRTFALSISLTASEHTECGTDCVGYKSDANVSTTITLNNLVISPGYVGSESITTSAPFIYSCSSTASGGKNGSLSESLNGYTFSISLLDPPKQGITLHYQGEPGYTYFPNTCDGTAQDPMWLIRKALAKSIGGEGPLLKYVYNINGETVPFSGRDHDAAISNDVSYFDWSGTITITPVR